MKIGLLTSSRSDYGIYKPLVKLMLEDSGINLKVIAFGTHLSPYHGQTIDEIQNSGIKDFDQVESILIGDTDTSISTSYGLTIIKFSEYWANNNFDIVLCLGDRYEMSAAVQAGIPYGIRFAHIHGGEKTLGAIDNIYRDQISLAAKMHFTTTNVYYLRVIELIQNNKNVYNVGSLSLDKLENFEFEDEKKFRKKFKLPNESFILVTFHPETINPEINTSLVLELKKSLITLLARNFLVITLPNADTNGSLYRQVLEDLYDMYPERILIIDNFGRENYFNAMKYCKFLLGNSSSGIIEAASFGKYVVNVGDRQLGRERSDNVKDCNFEYKAIIDCVKKVSSLGSYNGNNIYKGENTAKSILKIVKKSIHETS